MDTRAPNFWSVAPAAPLLLTAVVCTGGCCIYRSGYYIPATAALTIRQIHVI